MATKESFPLGVHLTPENWIGLNDSPPVQTKIPNSKEIFYFHVMFLLTWAEVKPHQINMLYIKIRIKKHMARTYGFFPSNTQLLFKGLI